MINTNYNLLTMLGDLYDKANDYSYYMKEADTDNIKLMLKDLSNDILILTDFIFENIDLNKVE